MKGKKKTLKKKNQGWWNSPVGCSTVCQAWWPEFNPSLGRMGQKERAEACQLSSDLYPLIIPAQEINKCERECTHRRYHSNPLRHHYKQCPGTFFFFLAKKQAKKPISGSGSQFHFATMVTFIYIYPKTVRKIKTQTIQKSTQQISIRTCLRQCRRHW